MGVHLNIGASRIAAASVAIVLMGAAAGFALERGNAIDFVAEREVVAALDAVPYFDCPDATRLDVLHRGDRVYLTGRSDDGAWVELRAPFRTTSRVWMEAAWLEADGAIESLPIVTCSERLLAQAEPAPVDFPGDTTTTSTAPDATTTTTTQPVSTTTSSSTSSTTTSSTTTTTQPESDPPVIGAISSDRSAIWEDLAYGGCQTQFHTSVITVTVTDASGIQSVTLHVTVADTPGIDTVLPMTFSGGVYTVTVGPFGDGDLSAGPVTADRTMSLAVTATDVHGATAVSPTNSSSLTIENCAIG